MRRLFTLTALLALAATTVSASVPLPGNLIDNGDFENGLTGWRVRGHCGQMVTTPESNLLQDGRVLRVRGYQSSCWAEQFIDESGLATTSRLLQFEARVLEGSSIDRPYFQLVGLLSDYDAAAQSVDKHALLQFWQDGSVRLFAYDAAGTRESLAPALMPAVGDWALYQVVLLHDIGTAVLLVNGVPQSVVQGTPTVLGPQFIWVGDIAVYAPTSPHMEADDFHYGQVPPDVLATAGAALAPGVALTLHPGTR